MSASGARFGSVIAVAVAAGAIAACTTSRPAPVSDRTPSARSAASPGASAQPVPPPKTSSAPARGDTHVVRPGDTLYSIALEHGVDYRELAIWNGIDNPGALRVGQELRVKPPTSTAVAEPLRSAPGTVQAQPLGSPATPPGPPAAPPPPGMPTPRPPAAGVSVVTEPRGVRVPYSEQAYAQLSKPEAAASARPAPRGEAAHGRDELDWGWPARGKVIATFTDSSSKGIAIAGKLGQPVLASAPGRVIFSGTGIRGFGKLIVIKHNNTYLSVYAHNSQLVVKEGQNVTRGQKIAEMGNTDADQVKLHFEIRRFGKPIDPLKLLPSPA